MMQTKLLYIFTRTPLHVGAGASVGAIDQPVQRERHTGFPIIPASSLKGSFSDAWNDDLHEQGDKKHLRITTREVDETKHASDKLSDAGWLFGSNNDKMALAGSLLFSEARLLAFPIRSARGCFAWITCPLMLQRAARDGALDPDSLGELSEPKDGEALFTNGKLDIDGKMVLEDTRLRGLGIAHPLIAAAFAQRSFPERYLLWGEIASRLCYTAVGMMSFFRHIRLRSRRACAY